VPTAIVTAVSPTAHRDRLGRCLTTLCRSTNAHPAASDQPTYVAVAVAIRHPTAIAHSGPTRILRQHRAAPRATMPPARYRKGSLWRDDEKNTFAGSMTRTQEVNFAALDPPNS
jgi:hypothetical protein